jgi:hypothetical protein
MLGMAEVHARLVDPRDARCEQWHPAYRVSLWARSGDGWASREFEIDRADVNDVLDWIREQPDVENFTLYAMVDQGENPGLVRLAGDDPTRSA